MWVAESYQDVSPAHPRRRRQRCRAGSIAPSTYGGRRRQTSAGSLAVVRSRSTHSDIIHSPSSSEGRSTQRSCASVPSHWPPPTTQDLFVAPLSKRRVIRSSHPPSHAPPTCHQTSFKLEHPQGPTDGQMLCNGIAFFFFQSVLLRSFPSQLFPVAAVFTALQAMQMRSSDENSAVRPSVRLSVCQTSNDLERRNGIYLRFFHRIR